ncbi:16S rRNA (uracil(1498)-N(3))-methyltransferase [Aurantimonas endophytica]|uniref:Ribosomal RNA small subunit methyltransferase E n=1 Tax=Aurantimonas endophytica TaxID=1522175 RepID=A0A7W6HCU3_9HYPH|nr:16S rRNA (uracil(1498)-N(3))-methyltransferase [Aurantimonas endophytica]MBB4002829.1 16S rRNA (uracil1498-N3)-methyltransferase [Aurantimonas endophytica]MCO6403706.1 16S rRNA (uracil(1498)-N(3))-methyltransferase [Aurantimonas endophytica]
MPSHDFKSPRLYVESDLADAEAIAATAVQANYLLNVLRLGESDTVLAFNGRDGEWRCELRKPAKKKLDLVPLARTRDQIPAPDLLYLFAPLKHARLDYMVQKAVEMGAGTLQPVMTQHVQASRINIDRMRANAVEAAEQCGILSIPDCREPIGFGTLLAGWDPARHLIFCDEREEAESPIETLRSMPPGRLALLVGPEGGFSQDERASLRALPFVTVMSLGPRILRADTAAVAALAVLQAAVGDWREG